MENFKFVLSWMSVLCWLIMPWTDLSAIILSILSIINSREVNFCTNPHLSLGKPRQHQTWNGNWAAWETSKCPYSPYQNSSGNTWHFDMNTGFLFFTCMCLLTDIVRKVGLPLKPRAQCCHISGEGFPCDADLLVVRLQHLVTRGVVLHHLTVS